MLPQMRARSNRRSHQVEYLIVTLKNLLLNDRGLGFYNAEVMDMQRSLKGNQPAKCTW